MRRNFAVVSMFLGSLLGLLVVASPVAAFEGGGRSPSEAPTISWGQHYTGQLNNHKEDANYAGEKEVAFWRLPPVSTHDQIVVNWHGLPFTHSPGSFPVCMMPVQGINNFNWGTIFSGGSCESPRGYELSGSGTAATPITIQNTDTSGSTYLEFWSSAYKTPSSGEQETFPYDFSVEAPRHYLNLTISPFSEVPANGVVHASVTGADGLPGPDGLVYGLTVRWKEGGIATYTAASVGGQISFQLALPESAFKKNAAFIVGRGADSSYQAVESPVNHAKVTEPVLPPPPSSSQGCKKAKLRVRVLSRQRRRLTANWHRARGIRRARLRHRARHVAGELRTARAKAVAACN
jgi:hypothetical protein